MLQTNLYPIEAKVLISNINFLGNTLTSIRIDLFNERLFERVAPCFIFCKSQV